MADQFPYNLYASVCGDAPSIDCSCHSSSRLMKSRFAAFLSRGRTCPHSSAAHDLPLHTIGCRRARVGHNVRLWLFPSPRSNKCVDVHYTQNEDVFSCARLAFLQIYQSNHVYIPFGVTYILALCIACSGRQRIQHFLDRSHYVSHRRVRFAGDGCHAICGSGQRLEFYFVSQRKYSRLTYSPALRFAC